MPSRLGGEPFGLVSPFGTFAGRGGGHVFCFNTCVVWGRGGVEGWRVRKVD